MRTEPRFQERAKAGSGYDGHHIIQDVAVRDLPGYSFGNAPAVRLAGPASEVGSPHYKATQIQRRSGGGTYASERRIGYRALCDAGLSRADARASIEYADRYFIDDLEIDFNTETRIPLNRR